MKLVLRAKEPGAQSPSAAEAAPTAVVTASLPEAKAVTLPPRQAPEAAPEGSGAQPHPGAQEGDTGFQPVRPQAGSLRHPGLPRKPHSTGPVPAPGTQPHPHPAPPSHAHPHHLHRRVRPAPSVGKLVLTVVGWVAVGVEIIVVVVLAMRASAQRQTNAAWYREERAKVGKDILARQAEVEAGQTAAAERLGKLQNDRATAMHNLKLAEFEIGRHVERLTEIEKRAAGQPPPAEAAAPPPPPPAAADTDELAAKVRQLEAERARLLEQFKTRYSEMKAALKKLVDDGNPDRLRQFYHGHRHTPLAPAAAFFAADAYYLKRQTRSAKTLYEEVAAQYPTSTYAAIVPARLTNLKERVPYSPYDVQGFHPYKIADSLDFGAW